MRRHIILALVAGMLGSCYYDEVAYASDDHGFVYAAPGVSVVTGLDYPVFYADNYYWQYNNGLWYRSNYYWGGWTWATPPAIVHGINAPWWYAHYHPYGYGYRYYGHAPYRGYGPYYGHRPYYSRSYYHHGGGHHR